MINRRHIRIKVMQSVYALLQSGSDNIDKEEKFLKNSITKMHDLYALMLLLLIEIKNAEKEHIKIASKKILATYDELNPNKKFVENKILTILEKSISLNNYLKNRNLDKYWYLEDKYIKNILADIKESKCYVDYMKSESTSFKEDRDFLVCVFKKVIAPNDTLYEYFEDKNLSWTDDIPFVNTMIVKELKNLKSSEPFSLGKLYKDEDDEKFVSDLFRKTVLNHHTYEKYIKGRTPNWDTDRIAEIDMILIKMTICEFLQFPSIPTKVSINEYIEISKDYSTEKSSFFINGVLDKLSKDFTSENKIKKIGRGLL